MTRDKQPRGSCNFCGREMTKGGLSKHFSSCLKIKEALNEGNKEFGENEKIYHLLIEFRWDKKFWLHLEMRGSAYLYDLDAYLRAIWLECCDHLSAFSTVGANREELSDEIPVQDILNKGLKFRHVYDFGSTTETLIKVVDEREGKPLSQHPIHLMARNNLPEMYCIECEQIATRLCLECMYENVGHGFLCEKHAGSHPHDEYGEPIELVNSPRLGVCAYTGPAKAPY